MRIVINYFVKPVYNFIKNFRLMILSRDVLIMPTSKIINSNLEGHVSIYEGVNIFNSSIGAYSYIQRHSTIGNCIVGRFCSIAENVKVGLGVHPVSEMVSSHPFCYGRNQDYWLDKKVSPACNFDIINEHEPVYIGNDVNIGTCVTILNGVTIGDGAIIGAGSVVTKNIPAYAVVAGVPAKIIKYRFCEEDIKKIHGLKWWEWDVNELKQKVNLFSSPLSLYRDTKRYETDD